MDKKISNVNLHDEALTIFKKMEPTKSEAKAKEVTSDYNARRKAQTGMLRPILTEMQARFEKGETIGASASMKEWCATYKDHGAFTYARVRQILTGKSGNENKKVKSLDLKDGVIVRFGGKEFKIVAGGAPESATDIQKTKIPGHFRLAMIITPIDQEEQPAPVLHTRASKQRTLCETRFINRPLLKGKKFAAKGETVTCPDCVRFATEEPRSFSQMEAEFRAKKKERKVKPVDPRKEFMKRFRAAKRAAKFYGGMMDEMGAVNRFREGGAYGGLLNLYADNEGRGDRRYPWTVPSENYNLPKTQKEFQAEYDKAFAEFDQVVNEGKATGVLVPREEKQVTIVVKENCPTDEEVV